MHHSVLRIRDPVFFNPLDPGSGSGMNFFRIPNHFDYDYEKLCS
jgi:hypothetical protein